MKYCSHCGHELTHYGHLLGGSEVLSCDKCGHLYSTVEAGGQLHKSPSKDEIRAELEAVKDHAVKASLGAGLDAKFAYAQVIDFINARLKQL